MAIFGGEKMYGPLSPPTDEWPRAEGRGAEGPSGRGAEWPRGRVAEWPRGEGPRGEGPRGEGREKGEKGEGEGGEGGGWCSGVINPHGHRRITEVVGVQFRSIS